MSRFGAILLCALLTACGTKGPVLPLLQPLPAAVEGGAVQQRGSELTLRWGRPAANQDGSGLNDLALFRIYRWQGEESSPCKECRLPDRPWRVVDAEYPRSQGEGGRFILTDTSVLPGYHYRYRIIPVTRDGFPGEARDLTAEVTLPVPPPEGVAAGARDSMVRLSWQAPETGNGVAIYRQSGDEEYRRIAGPVEGEVYDDFRVENGVTYRYRLRAIGGDGVEGSAGETVEATPREGL